MRTAALFLLLVCSAWAEAWLTFSPGQPTGPDDASRFRCLLYYAASDAAYNGDYLMAVKNGSASMPLAVGETVYLKVFRWSGSAWANDYAGQGFLGPFTMGDGDRLAVGLTSGTVHAEVHQASAAEAINEQVLLGFFVGWFVLWVAFCAYRMGGRQE